MAVRTREEILEEIKARVGEQTDDDTISFLEDVTDTLTDLENKGNNGEDWKTKYEQNDKQWRERYKERFFNKNDDNDLKDEDDTKGDSDNNKPLSYADLFK